MSWTNRTNRIEVGDQVAYNRQYLQSTGQQTGETPQMRGKVVGLKQVGEMTLASVLWDGEEEAKSVRVCCLARVTKDKGIVEPGL